jgi:hypothetical protein
LVAAGVVLRLAVDIRGLLFVEFVNIVDIMAVAAAPDVAWRITRWANRH